MGESHTLTARTTDVTGAPIQGANVTISVISGPNAGETSGPLTTDANGYATWSYTGIAVGTDIIEVSGTDPQGVVLVPTQAEKIWEDCGGPQIPEVGGTIQPTNKWVLLTPWIALGMLLAALGTIIVRRRSTQS